MTTVCFPSRDDCDVVELQLVGPNGHAVVHRLLVDCGFTGESSLVLPTEARAFAEAIVSASFASGAIQGRQSRVLVTCQIPVLACRLQLIAILADVSSLSLPPDITGMVGLSFLRRFSRWGAERREDGGWQFFLSNGDYP